ncbi:MAG: hypothetical protein DCC48_14140 [Acidobacteria bacterium]|nr:MAG: hypothetical protein DCC48_14140 [Acidobacteriota bacterium]
MPPRRSPAQIRSQLRQAQSRARSNQQKLNQAIRNYNRQVDKVNASRRKFVNEYNAAVRQYNRSVDAFNREQKRRAATARTNRSRLEQELRRLDRATTSRTVRTEFRTSVDSLAASAARFQDGHSAAWSTTDLGDLLQGEAANSVATLSALLTDEEVPDGDPEQVQQSMLRDVLEELDPEIGARWTGALFALNPANPDAARHFCTSAREMLADVLDRLAPSEVVEQDDPSCDRTPQGTVSRRARIHFCLKQGGVTDRALEDFAEEDIKNVLALFQEFNSATHGRSGKFNLGQLGALKRRVEDAIYFIMRLGTAPIG